jgi:hypothetical protein
MDDANSLVGWPGVFVCVCVRERALKRKFIFNFVRETPAEIHHTPVFIMHLCVSPSSQWDNFFSLASPRG